MRRSEAAVEQRSHRLGHGQEIGAMLDKITIGSATDNIIRIDDPGVSPHHCKIFKSSFGDWVIADQGSSTGTFVNGQGITRGDLHTGDKIVIGARRLLWPDDFETCTVTGEPQSGSALPPPIKPDSREEDLPAAGIFLIGTAPDCSPRLDDPGVEPHHCRISINPLGDWIVEDRGSRTGTFHNGLGVLRADLRPGDRLTVGGVTLTWPRDFQHPGERISKATQGEPTAVVFAAATIGYPGVRTPALTGVNLTFNRGEVTMIMGPSGIGKSTLCRAILGENELRGGTLSIDGVIQSPGQAPNPQQVSFVPQDTTLLESLTARQAVEFAASVRNAQRRGGQARTHVEALLTRLGLDGVADRRISKLSGGEKKRVSIAQELVSDPVVMLLDEPSSGLDEGFDRALIMQLKEIAQSPDRPAIVMVTHATSHVSLADKVCAIGGAIGQDEGRAKSAVRYAGIPDEFLPALTVGSFADAMDTLRSRKDDNKKIPSKFKHRFSSRGNWTLLGPLLRREWMLSGSWRQVLGIIGSLVGLAVLSRWLVHLIYDSNIGGVENGNGKLLQALSVLTFLMCFPALYLPTMRLVSDWPVTRREQRWGVSAKLHVLARVLFDLPVLLLIPIVTIGVTWDFDASLLEELRHGSLSIVLLTGLMAVLSSYSIGLLIGSLNTSSIRALRAVVGVITAMVILMGVVMDLTVASYIDWLSNLTPTRLTLATLASELDVAQGRGDLGGLDPKFYSSAVHRWIMIGGLAAIMVICFLTSLFATTRTMQNLDKRS